MLYCENWDKVQKKYLEFWARENHDRPLMKLQIIKDSQEKEPVSTHGTLRERWMDTEYILKRANWSMQNTRYFAEAFPNLSPNLGPDWFATGYGAQLEYGETTSWSGHFLTDQDVENYKGFVLNTQNVYYQKMDEILKAAVEDGKDKYMVGVTDIHPGADCLVSLRGPQNLCTDIYDYPEFIPKGTMDIFSDFKEIYNHQYEIVTKYQKGCTCWMGLWHPGKWYVPSCDFSCMVSEAQYNELIVGEIEKEVEFLDASIYHLDGPGALRHLDRILEIPGLNGVQWRYGAGQPSASHWIPVVKKIQAAGKCVEIEVQADELEVMLEEVDPEGVCFWITGVKDEAHAEFLMKMAEHRRRK